MEYDVPAETRMSSAIVEAVAEYENERIDSLPPLYDTIEPDALDTIVGDKDGGSSGFEGRISFTYSDSRITVQNSKKVTIQPAARIEAAD